LKEKVGLRRGFLTAAGFAGVLVVTPIGSGSFDPAVLYGIAAAISGAVTILLSRTLTHTETTISMMFYIGLVTTAGSTISLVFDPQPIGGTAFLLVALTGTLGAFGMAVTIEAYRFGEVPALAPASYLRLVFALAFGLAPFSEFPAWMTLAGVAIIVATALVSQRSEKREE
jgi:drug/metabolite transporter (DMT)-like permease